MGVVGVLIAFLMYSRAGTGCRRRSPAGDRAADRPVPGLAHRRSWRAVVRRHARRPDVVRGAAFLVADGKAQPVSDPVVPGAGRRPGGLARADLSWLPGAALSALLLWNVVSRRRNAQAHGFPMRPLWFDWTLALFFVGVLLVFVATMNAYVLADKGAGQASRSPC